MTWRDEPAARSALYRLRQVFLDVGDLVRPAAIIGLQRRGAPLQRDAIEPGLGDRQLRVVADRTQGKYDQSGRLARVVHARRDRIGVPAKCDAFHRLDALHPEIEFLALMG